MKKIYFKKRKINNLEKQSTQFQDSLHRDDDNHYVVIALDIYTNERRWRSQKYKNIPNSVLTRMKISDECQAFSNGAKITNYKATDPQ